MFYLVFLAFVLSSGHRYLITKQTPNTNLYDAGTSRSHCADHVNIGSGGGTMPLQRLAISTQHGEAKGGGWG